MASVPYKDPKLEHIAGNAEPLLAQLRTALPQYVDDITRDYGTGTYEKMLTDPAVEASFNYLKDGCLADGIRLTCAVEPPSDDDPNPDPKQKADHELSELYRAFVQRCLDGAETQIQDVAEEMLDGLLGNKVAEIVLKDGEGEDAGKLTLRAVKPRPRQNLAFVVDQFANTIGVLAVDPKSPLANLPVLGPIPEDLAKIENFVPIQQLVVFRWRPKNGDPRGTSLLRSSYNPWFLKTRVYPDYFRYLKQFASPSLIGKTPEGGPGFVPKENSDGSPELDGDQVPVLISDTASLLSSLLNFANSTALVVPGGTDVETLFSQGEGQAFLKAHDYFDRQIALGILGTTRLNQEAEHGSRADSGTAENVSGVRVRRIRRVLEDCLNHLPRFLVEVNFGADAVRLAPRFSLAGQEAQDWAAELDSVARAYGNGFIHSSQLPGLDKRLGLPARDMAAIAAEAEEKRHQAALLAGDMSKITHPLPEAA